MAVIKAKQEKVVQFFLGMLERELITPMVVTRVAQDFFNGAEGDTVTLRIGGLRAVARDYEWRTRTAPIVMDDIQGGEGIAVKLDTHVYSATALTDEHLTLDEINFAREVLAPQVAAVTDNFESKVAAGLRAAPFAADITFGDGADPHRVAAESRRVLDSFKVAPTSNRVFLIGSDVAAEWLVSDRLSTYDSTGQTGTPAVREATIGRLAGSPVIVSNALEPGEGYYLHKSALVLGNVAPVVPQGAVAGRTGISRNGFAVRWLQDYDAPYLRDRSIVSSFFGLTSVNDERDAAGDLLGPDANTGAGPRNVRAVRLDFTGSPGVLV